MAGPSPVTPSTRTGSSGRHLAAGCGVAASGVDYSHRAALRRPAQHGEQIERRRPGILGLAWDTCSVARAFRSEESTGMVNLGTTVPNRSTRANGVSGDGKVVVGWQQLTNGTFQAAKWVDGVQTLYTGAFGPIGDAWASNIDGSIIVGQECQPPNPLDQSAWIWSTANGVECLPVPRFRSALDGHFLGRADATSDDGRVIGGGHAAGLESEAVIWIDRQPHYLKDYLQQNGVRDAFDGWVNTGSITGISRDGRVLVGFGAGPRTSPATWSCCPRLETRSESEARPSVVFETGVHHKAHVLHARRGCRAHNRRWDADTDRKHQRGSRSTEGPLCVFAFARSDVCPCEVPASFRGSNGATA